MVAGAGEGGTWDVDVLDILRLSLNIFLRVGGELSRLFASK